MQKSLRAKKKNGGKLIERYLHGSAVLKAVFLLIDIRHEPGANDRIMYDWICANGFEPIIIATKLDKIKRSQVQKHIKAIRQGAERAPRHADPAFLSFDEAGPGRNLAGHRIAVHGTGRGDVRRGIKAAPA